MQVHKKTNGNIGLKKNVDAGLSEEKNMSTQQYIVFPLWSSISSSNKSSDETDEDDTRASSTNNFNIVGTPINTAGASRIFGDAGSSFVPLRKFTNLPHDPLMPDLEDTAEVPNT
ncbi:hypothetical protein Tco_0882607, partial [Tanacetum coccineum]